MAIVINSTTGEIDLDQTTPGTYVVTYTVQGVSSTQEVTVNAVDNATFSYSATSYETSDPDPTPAITGLTGGTFSGTTGLVFVDSGTNTGSSTGQIDLSASTAASHTVTYNTSSSSSSVCPNTSTFGLDILSPMLMVWRTTTPSESVAIVGQSLGNTEEAIYYDFTIDWGDSTAVESYSGTSGKNISHTYATAGDHEVKISGKYAGIVSNTNPDSTKLIEFKQWGTCTIRAFDYMFRNCTNMTYTATDSPTWNNSLTNRGFRSVFRNCSSITSLDMSGWSSAMLSYAWDNNSYVDYVFESCTNAEQITLPDGISSSARSLQGMFQSCGTATTDGVEIVFKIHTNSKSGLALAGFLGYTKIKFANIINWTINSAGGTYMFRSNPDVVGSYVDMSNWTTTGSGLNSFYIRTARVDEIRLNNWNANMTQNITSLSHAWYGTDVERIIGLENWNFNGTSTIQNWLAGVSKLSFSTGRNFGTNSMTSGNMSTISGAFNSVGAGLSATQQADSYAPNIGNWNVSNVSSFVSVFYGSVFNLNDVDISNWDFGTATSLATMFRYYNRSAVSRGTRTFEVAISTLTSSCLHLSSMCRDSAVTDIDFRGSDLSGITTFSHFWLGSYAPSGHVSRFRIDTNANLSSVTNMSNFAKTIHTDDYDLLITRLEATNNNSSGSMAIGAGIYLSLIHISEPTRPY